MRRVIASRQLPRRTLIARTVTTRDANIFKTITVFSMPNPQLPDNFVNTLISEVKARECLWNTKHDSYNERYKMRKAWAEISEKLQVEESKLRIKWKNLRDIFKKECKRYCMVEPYLGKWRYYNLMKFIQTNEPIELKEEIEEYCIVTDEKEEEGGEEEGGGDEEEVEICFEDTYEDPLPEKRRKISTDEEDYDIMFLKSLAPYFRQLNPMRKLVVRNKMQDMLLNEITAQTSKNRFS